MRKSKYVLSYAYMKRRIAGYGFEYSLRDFMKVTLLVFAGLAIAGWLYDLRWNYILFSILAALLTLPTILVAQFRYLYEQKRFSDAVSYMEQMIYMFKKRPQILYALRETREILDGTARELCEQAIAYIETGVCEKNLYREGLSCIEKEYGCERIRLLHRFMLQVEEEGGAFQSSINLLLEDLKTWTQRVYEFQKERKKIKKNITMSILAALIICFFTTKMFPSEYHVSDFTIYQVMTTSMIVLLILLYAIVQSVMNGTWLEADVKREEKVQRDYERAVLGRPKRIAKAAKKRTEREIEKAFPVWLRNLSVTLQRQPVPAAITDSIHSAPVVLKIPLGKMIREFDTDLVTIKPYRNFLSEFELPEVSSAMKMLYALNSADKEDMQGQIHALIERNMKLQEKGERLREEDKTVLSGFMVALPMCVSFVKLVTDMLLMVMCFLNKFSGYI